ncbi:MAG: lipopolysaccharide transport periplasmic protein LptA [Candidatus Electrothrix sp. AW2]|jgi:lipopolysaccharide export system protein LptA|nr:lipopolysaccharide transport periplasmic protein LptA [Candidatus Electrothrix sp. AX1]MCI5117691.1 lipopolysaccharide transport periplasmic protein LptA [Candidatus Electrothrix gigas]MCI5128222.1 lipopolysaccharide transport periplasmic protein LptA [Candidatus Electrothrix gigas]MCI5134299.1 lipopolysaccharide transport periplasmic protein LptA [Candidatus Electrothrix gigas]MCI5180089.1 lipopolysaccharide transport periplasmic protein LptA [Candidatus Electrothrix gigas]
MYFFLLSVRKTLQAVFIFCILCLVTSSGFCQDNNDPINIEADRMVSQEKQNSVVFMGNVNASQGKMTIRTDKMTIYYRTDKSQKNQQMDRMVCIGKVKITQENWLGTGDRMEYFANIRKVVLSGNAKTWQGQNMVSGKTITYYIDEKRSEVDRDKTATGDGKKQQRVRATIIPNSGKKK